MELYYPSKTCTILSMLIFLQPLSGHAKLLADYATRLKREKKQNLRR